MFRVLTRLCAAVVAFLSAAVAASRRLGGLCLVTILLGLAVWPQVGEAGTSAPEPLPLRLSETGLYVANSVSQVRVDKLPFAPQYPLWSDGASKRRWIHLPPGTHIDASVPDVWRFPVGTRFWKEFAHGGRPIETRMIEHLPDGTWRFATYVWNLQGTDALLAPERGVRNLPAPDAPGGLYAVPSQNDCRLCHEGGASPVLGFGALQLSPQRDPFAAHAEMPAPDMLDLRSLQARGLLRKLPQAIQHTPPRIDAVDATSRAALGYLHANCSHCHNDTGPLASMNMSMVQSTVDAFASARRTWSTLFGQPSRYRGNGGAPQSYRVAPEHVDASTLLEHMASPHPMRRMPPIGVSAAITLIAATSLAGPPAQAQQPAPGTSAAAGRPAVAADRMHKGELIERGKYIVSSAGCHDCHTPWHIGPNGPEPDMSRALSGHPQALVMPPAPKLPDGPWLVVSSATNTAISGPWGVSFTSNLTPDAETGLGKWSARDFIDTIRNGLRMGRGRELLPPMPYPVYNHLTDADLTAVYHYLQSIRPIPNRVPEPRPPAAPVAGKS